MAEFYKCITDDDCYWINLSAICCVKHDNGKLLVKMADQSTLTIDGENLKELSWALDMLSLNDQIPTKKDVYSWAADDLDIPAQELAQSDIFDYPDDNEGDF